MKKKIMSLLMATMLSLSIVACGGGGTKEPQQKEPAKKEYIEETQIADLFTNPDNFKGKYVKLSGKIFTTPEKSGSDIALQAWHDPSTASNNFIVYYTSDTETFAQDDYIIVDGKIEGSFEGENAFGGKVTAPLITADSIEVQSYMDAVVPTIKEVVPENAVYDQNGITLKVDKVEFAEQETRVYLTETNASADKFNMWTYSIKLTQNGQQFEQEYSTSAYDGDYPELASEILPNVSSSGILVFPAMDSSASIQLHAEGSSDNWELDFAPFTIDIPVQ